MEIIMMILIGITVVYQGFSIPGAHWIGIAGGLLCLRVIIAIGTLRHQRFLALALANRSAEFMYHMCMVQLEKDKKDDSGSD